VSDNAATELQGAGSLQILMMMMIRFVAAVFMAAPLVAQAQPGDPLRSSACASAQAELEVALAENASNPQARAQRLANARKQAALACLGPSSGERQRSGAPEPVQVVPPTAIAVPSAPPAPPSPATAPLPQLDIPRPATMTTCDPGGCWDNNGKRLNQVGPTLIGPHGPCGMYGGVVTCP
jgi:hypothetical protein